MSKLTPAGKTVAALIPEYRKAMIVLQELHDAVLDHPGLPPLEERLVAAIQAARDIVHPEWRESEPDQAREVDAVWAEFFRRVGVGYRAR